jgi:hypothetical protein
MYAQHHARYRIHAKKKFRQEHISNRVHVLQKLIPGGAKMVRWKPLDEAAD